MYVLIVNIPPDFHTKELRNYFYEFTKKEVFDCFHYRHRPQADTVSIINDLEITDTCLNEELLSNVENIKETIKKISSQHHWNHCGNCVYIEIKDVFLQSFTDAYNTKFWVNLEGDTLPYKCYIIQISPLIELWKSSESAGIFKTKNEHLADRKQVNFNSISSMIELNPPAMMPHGNIGTSAHFFNDLIKSCQLPSSLIAKLGLQSTKRKVKKYGTVPMDYGTALLDKEEPSPSVVFTANGHFIPNFLNSTSKKKNKLVGPEMELVNESEEDGNEVEEWDRHEAFTDDPSNQERNKERSYEPEIEQVWEKGGPGLVFYTDATFWREREGDFDEQTADEFNVDMSGYYGGTADRDSRDCASMRTADALRSGNHSISVFNKRSSKPDESMKKIKGPWRGPDTIGKFEAHTKGFGRRFMEAQGWKDGDGLGSSSKGIPYALDSDGQHPLDKKGFGYHGEKVIFTQSRGAVPSKKISSKAPIISTVFDNPSETDNKTSLKRRLEPTALSHRKHPYSTFSKGS